MTFHDDPDLERRLRHIAEEPKPPVPESVYRYAGEVARHEGGTRMRLSFRLGRGLFPVVSAVGVIGAIAVAVLVAGLVLSARSNLAAQQSPPASASTVAPGATPTPSPFVRPTHAVSPAPTMIATGFTTPGVADGWKGFTWTHLAAGSAMLYDSQVPGSGIGQVLHWKGGYVATGSVGLFGSPWPSLGLWTSPDGQTWTPVTSIDATAVVLVSVAPIGLLAVAVDATGSSMPGSVWTTSDGISWHDAGVSNLPGSPVSIAGTDTGIVATVGVQSGTGKSATETFLVEFSTDGVNWTPETVGDLGNSAGGAFGLPPHVQSNGGQFFLMGTPAPLASTTGFVLASSQASDEMWLSGDGRTWTRSGGGYSMFADFIDFGRDGMLLHTNANAVPGANGQAYSTDGGKTWHEDAHYGPLGQTPCQGECSTGPDGAIAANGTYFLAVKNGGKQAWLSYDGHTWTPIQWTGGDPFAAGYGGFGGFVVMPRGVLLAGAYGAAQ